MPFTNDYPGRCIECGCWVRAGQGMAKKIARKWAVLCASHRTEPVHAAPATDQTHAGDPTRTVDLPATAHGWVRRPDLDTPTIDAWERPDGTIYAARKGSKPRVVTLVGPASLRDGTDP